MALCTGITAGRRGVGVGVGIGGRDLLRVSVLISHRQRCRLAISL